MPTIEVTPQAYEIITRRSQETESSPDEVASQMIITEAVKTEHPYIECRPDVLGGKPAIKNSRIAVWQIAERLKLGDSPDDLLEAYTHLSAAAVHDAISYYYDHRAEIERQMEENRLETALVKHQAVIDEHGQIKFKDSPSGV